MIYPAVRDYFNELSISFESIPKERKLLLEKIGQYILNKQMLHTPANLVYICTHNSRRSHFAQVWCRIAADYYGIESIFSYSGGTEATAFHANALAALKRTGLQVHQLTAEISNPQYEVRHGDTESASICFSKRYDDRINPQKDFAAIMTCAEAEENCPFIPGAELRIGTTYVDPKAFDKTVQQDLEYDASCRQIAMETLYVFYFCRQNRQETNHGYDSK